jgi:hypothetical protein
MSADGPLEVAPGGTQFVGLRYALYGSYVLLVRPALEPISHPIRAWFPLGKAQRLDRQAYESPALPLSYSATANRISVKHWERQLTTLCRALAFLAT